MQKRIELTKQLIKDRQLELHTEDESFNKLNLRASGRMLVDSDALSFIYILENNEEFVYVSLTSNLWSSLKEVIDEKLDVILFIGNQTINLEGLIEELTYLISNIEGNANYGEQMVSQVEEIFVKA